MRMIVLQEDISRLIWVVQVKFIAHENANMNKKCIAENKACSHENFDQKNNLDVITIISSHQKGLST